MSPYAVRPDSYTNQCPPRKKQLLSADGKRAVATVAKLTAGAKKTKRVSATTTAAPPSKSKALQGHASRAHEEEDWARLEEPAR